MIIIDMSSLSCVLSVIHCNGIVTCLLFTHYQVAVMQEYY